MVKLNHFLILPTNHWLRFSPQKDLTGLRFRTGSSRLDYIWCIPERSKQTKKAKLETVWDKPVPPALVLLAEWPDDRIQESKKGQQKHDLKTSVRTRRSVRLS